MSLLKFIENQNLSKGAKMVLLEKVLEVYTSSRKEIEQMEDENRKKKDEIDEASEKLEKVSALTNSLERVEKELKQFKGLGEIENIEEKIEIIKENRIKYINQILKTLKVNLYNNFANMLEVGGRGFLSGKFLIPLLFLILGLSFILYMGSMDDRILSAGFVAFGINFFLFLLINISNVDRVGNVESLGIDYSGDLSDTYEELINKLDKREDRFLVDSAWYSALTKEKSNILQAISLRLDGDDYGELKTKVEYLYNEIEANDLAMSKITHVDLPSGDFESIRTEIDILEMELEDQDIDPSSILKELRMLHIKGVDKLPQNEIQVIMPFLREAQTEFQFEVS